MGYYQEFMERSTETAGKCSMNAKMTTAEMGQIALAIMMNDLSIDDKYLLDCLEKLKVSKDRATEFVREVLFSRNKLF